MGACTALGVKSSASVTVGSPPAPPPLLPPQPARASTRTARRTERGRGTAGSGSGRGRTFRAMASLRAPKGLCAAGRARCAAMALSARWVGIARDATIESGGVSGLDAELHFLGAAPEEVARYVL